MVGEPPAHAEPSRTDAGPTGIAVASVQLTPRQPALPPLRDVMRPSLPDGDGFAHPAERHFSRLLSYYRIRWVYEPTTFCLARAADGRPAEQFTPDFYLPDQRLYIELTTMRQRLVTRKNRKLRRLRELYPNVRIKLLYRRDYQRLLDAYRGADPPPPGRVGRVLFGEDEIRARAAELASVIAADQAGVATAEGDRAAPLLVLGVGRGSEVFVQTLAPLLAANGLPVEIDRVVLSRYRGSTGTRRVRVRRGPSAALAGRRVLLVEEVVSTGLSLEYLCRWLRRRQVAGVDVCALLDRSTARLVDVPVRYAGFPAPDELLVGFGLSLRRQFRELPFIAAFERVDPVPDPA